MDDPPQADGAVLVVTVWFERGATGDGFRARITRTTRVREPGLSTVVTERERVLATVADWLDGLG